MDPFNSACTQVTYNYMQLSLLVVSYAKEQNHSDLQVTQVIINLHLCISCITFSQFTKIKMGVEGKLDVNDL